jgi:hypothetical protein
MESREYSHYAGDNCSLRSLSILIRDDVIGEGFQVQEESACLFLWPGAFRAGLFHTDFSALSCEGADTRARPVPGRPRILRRVRRPVAAGTAACKGRAHRDKVKAKVMADPRMHKAPPEMPFHPRRMAYGGFKMIVAA